MSSPAQVAQLSLATDRTTDAEDHEAQAFQQRLSSKNEKMRELQRLARAVQLAFEGLTAVELDTQRTVEAVTELIARLLHDSPWNDIQQLLKRPLDESLMRVVNGCIFTAMIITFNAVNLLKVIALQEEGQERFRNISGSILCALRAALMDFNLAMQLMNTLVDEWAAAPEAQRRRLLDDIATYLDLAISMMQTCEEEVSILLHSKQTNAVYVNKRRCVAQQHMAIDARLLARRLLPLVNKNVDVISVAGGLGLLDFATYKSFQDIGKIREHLKPGMACCMKQLEDTAAILKDDMEKLISDIQAATRNN